MSTQDGGSAFPRYEPAGVPGPHWQADPEIRYAGMSLRDYFAAQAIVGVLFGKHPDVSLSTHTDVAAQMAYAVADEMLKERAK